MLSDDEFAALRDIERRLRWHSPELVRLFDSVEPQQATKHRPRARTRALIAGAAVTGLALLGPRLLTEAEVQTQRRRPLPRTAPADSAFAERADPVSGAAAPASPVGGMDIFITPSTIVAMPSRHGPCAQEGPARLLDRQPLHVESLSREALTFQQITARTRQRVPTTEARAELERK
ncbi:MAG: DUF3040 domain-containing protein [Mycobacterium sp.]|jgi:hypothetical protein|uniref:DUF3040 domain-containing protein n=1 Tax=Mycobacterium sp. TaxID=1785 RepID=UPI0038999785